jgi:hypothetical protein
MDINKLWQEIIDIGYETRKNNKNGLEIWQPLKKQYQNYDIKFVINTSFINLTKEINYSHKLLDDDHKNVTIIINYTMLDNTIPDEHFLIQHFRIPIMENFNLQLFKLLQIAYNIGQSKALFEMKKYNQDIIDFYMKNKLDKLITYTQNVKEIKLSRPLNYKKSKKTKKSKKSKKSRKSRN